MSSEAYLERMRDFHATINASPMWEADREMFLPGEIEYRTRLARERDGIPLPADLLAELRDLGRTQA